MTHKQQYLFAIGCLINKRLMENNDEAAERGKELRKQVKVETKPDIAYKGLGKSIILSCYPGIDKVNNPNEEDLDEVFWFCVWRDISRR